ncbi:MAG: hypothetical protein LIP23_06855 [Planctomycetes bacterium]|nr:hypothetical protein [Planctomycetota bacterium]
MAGSIIGGALLGLGASSLMKKQGAAKLGSQTATPAAAPAPETPQIAPEPGTTDSGNELMEAERERERQAALIRKAQAQETFTSGLGAAGQAATVKKSLLGG